MMNYYAEVEALLRAKLPGVEKVVIFDDTIRRREKGSARPRRPDTLCSRNTREAPLTTERGRKTIAGTLSNRQCLATHPEPHVRYSLGGLDWRSTNQSDFVKVNLLYPKDAVDAAVGEERAPGPDSSNSTDGYMVKGEQYVIAPNGKYRFYYIEDMMPEEALFIKCFDSRSSLMTDGATSDVWSFMGDKGFLREQELMIIYSYYFHIINAYKLGTQAKPT